MGGIASESVLALAAAALLLPVVARDKTQQPCESGTGGGGRTLTPFGRGF